VLDLKRWTMGKWKAVRKVKEQDGLLKSIVAMMIKNSGFAEEFDVPVGLLVMTQRDTGRPTAVVTYLMDSPEVADNMTVVTTYKMSKDEAMKILNVGAGAAITWLKPRAMDMIARSVLEGAISMPDLLSLVAYETVTPPTDLDGDSQAGREFNNVLGRVALESYSFGTAPIEE